MKKLVLICSIIIGLTLHSERAKADDYLWIGGTNSEWTNGNNWYNTRGGLLGLGTPNNGYPDATDDNAYISTTGTLGSLLIGLIRALLGGAYNQPTLNISHNIGTLNIGDTFFKLGTPNNVLTLGANVTLTATDINITGATTTIIAGTSTSLLKGTNLTTSNSVSLVENAPLTISGTTTMNAGTAITSNATGVINTTNFTLTTGTGIINNTGSITVNSAFTIGNGSTSSALDITGAGAVIVGATGSPGAIATISTAAKLNLGTASNHTTNVTFKSPIINIGSNAATGISNFGTLNFTPATTATVTFGASSTITNNSGGTITATGTTFTLSGSSSNVTNAGTFTASGVSKFTLGSLASITNTGTFNAGTSNSSCSITTITNPTADKIVIANTGTFNVGSTSNITIGNTTTGKSITVSNSGTGVFTFQSDEFGSASVGQIPIVGGGGVNSFTGNYDVQRYLTGGAAKYRGYRLISSPTNVSGNIDIGNLNNTANISALGAFTGGPAAPPVFNINQPTPSIYLYDERVIPSSTGFNSGKHKGITNIRNGGTATSSVDIAGGSSLATTLTNVKVPVGNGYIFYDIGSTAQTGNTAAGSTPASFAFTQKGALNQGPITVNLWYAPTGGTGKLSFTSTLASPGYNMVGNPYAATLDLNKVITDNLNATTGIENYIYELSGDNSNGQQYIVYKSAGGSAPSASQYVLSGQGFIVRAKTTSSVLIFKESEKDFPFPSHTPSPVLLSTAPVPADQVAGFYMKMEQDSLVNDYCGIYFSKDWSDTYDKEDAIDLDGTAPKVYMSSYTSDTRRTAVNDLADYKGGKTIKLYVNASTDGIYKLKIEQIKNIDPTYDIWLKDSFKKDSLDFRSNDTYNFNVTRSNAATLGADRFTIVIRRKQLPAYQFLSLNGSLAGAVINLKWKTQNEGNFTGFTVERLNANKQYDPLHYIQSDGSGIYSFTDNTPATGVNIYRIKQDDIDNKITYSADIAVNTIKTIAQNGKFIVYPNPATSVINIQFTSDLTGPANVIIANSTGTMISKQTFTQAQGIIDISKLKTGVYFVKITSIQSGQEIGSEGFVKL